ncbi:MAG: VWA domain-containing protein [Candidatus Aenigmatarchaeota archaeon]
MRRGFLLSLDAMVAASLLVLVALFLTGLSFTYSSPELGYQRLYYTGKDVINVMGQVEIGDLQDFSSIQYYLSTGDLVEDDLDKTLLDIVGALWSTGNITEAQNITKDVLGNLFSNSRVGYEILINNESIYRNGTSKGKYFSRFSTIVSGFDVGEPVSGFVSRVFLTKVGKIGSKYVYFGGYVGDGNITRIVELPSYDNLVNVSLELDAGNNFTLYVNGIYSGFYENNSIGNLTADKWEMDSAYFTNFNQNSNSTLSIQFPKNKSNFIGGGYIKITYNTSQLITEPDSKFGSNATNRYWFPGIEGIINLFSSFYVPGNLSNLTIYLHYTSNISVNQTGVAVFTRIGDTEIWRSNNLSEQRITLNTTYLETILNFSNMNEVTIPLRFGTEEFSSEEGLGSTDAVLITDRSGSMGICDVSSPLGPCDCGAPAPCNRERINVVRDADTDFVESVLENKTGNRVSLVTYGSDLSCGSHDFSSDIVSLQTDINTYDSTCGSTCIACGIFDATRRLRDETLIYSAINRSTTWLYNTSYPDSEPPVENASEWTNKSYNDTFWQSGDAILGFESVGYDYLPNIDTNTGNNGGSYFLRKHFDVNDVSTVESAQFFIMADDAVELYLNGHLIENDTNEYNGTYWNRPNLIFFDGFENDSVSYLVETEDTGEFSYVDGFATTSSCACSGPSGTCIRHEGATTDFSNATMTYSRTDGTYNITVRYCPESDSSAPHDEWRVYVDDVEVDNWFANELTQSWTDRTIQNIVVNNGEEITLECDRTSGSTYCRADYITLGQGGSSSPLSGWTVDSTNDGGVVTVSQSEALSGTNVVKFYGDGSSPNEMWIEKEINISNITSAILEYYWRVEDLETGEYGYLDVYDGAWHTEVRTHTGNNGDHTTNSGDYYREIVNLNIFNHVDDFKIRFRSNAIDAESSDTFLLDNVSVFEQVIVYNVPAAQLPGGTPYFYTGDNVVAVKLKNDDAESAKFDLEMNITRSRFKSMLVMSDGQANVCIPGSSCANAVASADAIARACEARDEFNITVYAVAFGATADVDTLNKTACWDCEADDWIPNCNRFFNSSNADDLQEIYKRIAQDIVEASFVAQILNISGNASINSTLFNDSFINFDYVTTIEPPEYGEATLTFEMPRLSISTGSATITNNTTTTKEGWFFVPNFTKVIDSKITSYSSEYWTDRLYVKNESDDNWNLVYWLGNYSDEYLGLGDPYIVQIPPEYLGVGENNSVRLGTGVSPDNGTGGSPDARVIYTLRIGNINLQGYSDVFPKGKGSTVTVYYDFNGDDIVDGSSNVAVGADPTDIFDPQNDSVDDAFMRLLNNLNFIFDKNINSYGDGTIGDPYDGLNDTNPIDLQITEEVNFDSSSIGGIPSLWGPSELEIRIWI